MSHSGECKPTAGQVKRGLRRIGYSQARAARETEQSQALVSMVLNCQMKSQPCLAKLAALINSQTEAVHA